MSANPTVSIVLPTHNGQRYLVESINSVLAQSFVDWELILVDDFSTDTTPEICRRYAEADARIRYVRLDPNRKLPGALNEGFRLATGEYWTWTSDDNRYRPQAIERMVQVLRANPEVGLVYAGTTIIDDKGHKVHKVAVQPPHKLAVSSVVGACFLYRSSVAAQVGEYDESRFCAEDYDYWLRIACAVPIAPIDEDLYEYRRHDGSLTSRKRMQIIEATSEIMRQHLPNLPSLTRKQRAEAWAWLARLYCFSGKVGPMRTALWHAITDGGVVVIGKVQRPALAAFLGRDRMYRLVKAHHLLDPHSEELNSVDWWQLV